MVTVMYRENLHVEIALLASLLLHVFAIGTWQYRDTLMKLTGLSSLTPLLPRGARAGTARPAAGADDDLRGSGRAAPKTTAEGKGSPTLHGDRRVAGHR